MPTSFNVPSTVIIGAGASAELGALVQRLGARRVLLVTDTFLERTGVAARFVDQLERSGIVADVFADVQPDPTVRNVQAGLARLRQTDADIVVALGGGSPIDAAKAISVLATNPEPLSQYAGYHNISRAGVPLIAISTTAGTQACDYRQSFTSFLSASYLPTQYSTPVLALSAPPCRVSRFVT